MSTLSSRSGKQVSSVYPTYTPYTHIKGQNPVCVCVCVCVWPSQSQSSHADSRFFFAFLAHLSQRLIGELIVYSWSGVRRMSSSSYVVHNFKHLLLRNRWADQSQILFGASLGRGNYILFTASGSHDQDGRHAHIW